jgi:hypothetical protein
VRITGSYKEKPMASKKTVMVKWLLVSPKGQAFAWENSLYAAILLREEAGIQAEIQMEVTIIERKQPSHQDMAEALCLD